MEHTEHGQWPLAAGFQWLIANGTYIPEDDACLIGNSGDIPIDRKHFHPFKYGIRVRCLRHVFAPYHELFRTDNKIEKLQPKVKLWLKTNNFNKQN